MRTSELDYNLPEHLIAQHPPGKREESRLLVLGWKQSVPEHRFFPAIIDYLDHGDCLVLNETRVIPARFFIRRATGGRLEGLFLNLTAEGDWQVLLKSATRLKEGERVRLVDPLDEADHRELPSMTIRQKLGQGHWLLTGEFIQSHLEILERYGISPLPPYIRRPVGTNNKMIEQDRYRYQTVYALHPGSVAAPTAGLHFTAGLLARLQQKGIQIARITLHVGLGTFKPVTAAKLEEHVMHAEQYEVDEANAAIINRTIDQSGRVVAVGTTSIRTLESVARDKRVCAGSGSTDLFIRPGYEFQIVRGAITNFHLPRSTLLALVCALAGTERTLGAYREAVQRGYRFFSYGDAMLVRHIPSS